MVTFDPWPIDEYDSFDGDDILDDDVDDLFDDTDDAED
jgi:hypothetical protein